MSKGKTNKPSRKKIKKISKKVLTKTKKCAIIKLKKKTKVVIKMTELVNKMLTTNSTAKYFRTCAEIAEWLDEYSTVASDIFYQLHNNGLVDIVFDGDIIFVVEGIAKTVEDINNLLKWVDSHLIKITKNNSTGYIVVRVVL